MWPRPVGCLGRVGKYSVPDNLFVHTLTNQFFVDACIGKSDSCQSFFKPWQASSEFRLEPVNLTWPEIAWEVGFQLELDPEVAGNARDLEVGIHLEFEVGAVSNKRNSH